MTFEKIIFGYVKQTFNDQGQCIKQEFITDGETKFEYEGHEINPNDMPFGGNEYYTFDMIQPK